MKHVLILGANGVLGSEITRQLALYKDIEQTCYDIRQISYKRINGRNICADVCDRKALEKAVAGYYGLLWKRYAAMYPDYIQAADCIVNSGIPYTLIRTADLTEADSMAYHLHKAGEKAHSRYVSRAAVANLIIKIIMSDDNFGLNESIGITD